MDPLHAPIQKDDRVELDLHPLNTWEQIEKVAALLVEYHKVQFRNKVDGPEARVWFFQFEGVDYKLQHFVNVGNSIVTANSQSALATLEKFRHTLNRILGAK